MEKVLLRFQWNDVVFECLVKITDSIGNNFLHEFDKASLIYELDLNICQLFSGAKLIGVENDSNSEFEDSFPCQLGQFPSTLYANVATLDLLKNKVLLSTLVKLDEYNKFSTTRKIQIGDSSCIVAINDKYYYSEEPVNLIMVNIQLEGNNVIVYFNMESLQKLIFLFNHDLSITGKDDNQLQVEIALNIFVYYLHLLGLNAGLLSWQLKRVKPLKMLRVNICYGEIFWFLLLADTETNFLTWLLGSYEVFNEENSRLPLIKAEEKLSYKVVSIVNDYSFGVLNRLVAGDILLSNQLSGKEEYFIDLGSTLLGVAPDPLKKLKLISKTVI